MSICTKNVTRNENDNKNKNKIKKFEGLRLKAYVCAAGVCTIGYGHTAGVKPGDVITEAQADAFFESDIRAVENQVNALPLDLGQYQFDAVVSFCFNVGIGKFKKSTLYKKIRADAYDSSIPAEFKKWIYGGGKILPGLVTRREWEAKRYQGLTI